MKRNLLMLMAILSLSFLTGCGSDDDGWVIEEVISELQVGMTVDEATELIGEEPESISDTGISQNITWRDSTGDSIMVWFFDGYLENVITITHDN